MARTVRRHASSPSSFSSGSPWDCTTSCSWRGLFQRSRQLASADSWVQYAEYHDSELPYPGRHTPLEKFISDMSEDGQTEEAKAKLELWKARLEQKERPVWTTPTCSTVTLTVLQ